MSKQTTYDKLRILGVEVDAITMPEAISYISARAQDPAAAPMYCIKPYVEFLDRAAQDPELEELLNNCELSIADGVAVTWAACYLYAGRHTRRRFWLTLAQIVLAPKKLDWPLVDRAAGINFTWPLVEMAAQRGLRVYLLGRGTDGDIRATANFLKHKLPELNVVGTACGRDETMPLGEVSDQWLEEAAGHIKRTKPDLVLVGMGFPLQERVCAYLTANSSHGVFIGEGGTFNYEAFGGTKPKAPAVFQRLGLEWLWRLIIEPRRATRQLAIPRYIYRIYRSR